MSQKILLVEDDEKLGRQVAGHLEKAGFQVDWVKDGEDALAVSPRPYSLMILDLMLPGAYGLDVLKHLRNGSDLPVLVLSARNDTGDKVRALQLGADDYMTKPFWPEELLARVQARLRRQVLERDGLIEGGGLLLDLKARRVMVKEAPVDLTKVEFDLLVALARKPRQVFTRELLLEQVWGYRHAADTRLVNVHVQRLRAKIERDPEKPEVVLTVRGVGYKAGPP